jgi:diphosphoinositol-polyphosphate diphosphatase
MPHTIGGPPPTVARQGREQQKYGEDGSRLVAGCIPVRYLPDVAGPSGVRVCMINSRNGKGFVFPKGGWEIDESVELAAQRETVEEAGLRGVLEEPLLGKFEFSSGKTGRARCTAYMFAMLVGEELKSWPESSQRERRWCSLEEAYGLAKTDWMRDALRAWAARKGWESALGRNGTQ